MNPDKPAEVHANVTSPQAAINNAPSNTSPAGNSNNPSKPTPTHANQSSETPDTPATNTSSTTEGNAAQQTVTSVTNDCTITGTSGPSNDSPPATVDPILDTPEAAEPSRSRRQNLAATVLRYGEEISAKNKLISELEERIAVLTQSRGGVTEGLLTGDNELELVQSKLTECER